MHPNHLTLIAHETIKWAQRKYDKASLEELAAAFRTAAIACDESHQLVESKKLAEQIK